MPECVRHHPGQGYVLHLSALGQWAEDGLLDGVGSFSSGVAQRNGSGPGPPVMGRFHRPGDEKRSVVVLEPAQFETWMNADRRLATALLNAPAAGVLQAQEASTAGQVGVTQGLFKAGSRHSVRYRRMSGLGRK